MRKHFWPHSAFNSCLQSFRVRDSCFAFTSEGKMNQCQHKGPAKITGIILIQCILKLQLKYNKTVTNKQNTIYMSIKSK